MVKEEEYLMTNQEILGGLKSAIERGGNLKEAMMTFYRAGYEKHEIEEAAKAYIDLGKITAQTLEMKPNSIKPLTKKEEKSDKVKTKQKIFSTMGEKQESGIRGGGEQNAKSETVQKISQYESKVKEPIKGKSITLVLVFILIALLGFLALVILFKDEIVVFFNNLFG